MIEFEFESTPETDAMLKQLCVKECFVRCKDCKYRDNDYCKEHHDHIDREEFCSRGERAE